MSDRFRRLEQYLLQVFGRARTSLHEDVLLGRGSVLPRSVARVAAVATLATAVLYILVAGAVDVLSSHNVMAEVDAKLETYLNTGQIRSLSPNQDQSLPDRVPLVTWVVVDNQAYAISRLPYPNPPLPPSLYDVSAPSTASIGGTQMRVAGRAVSVPIGGAYAPGRLVAAESLAPITQAQDALLTSELVAGIPLLVLVFIGSFLIGWRSVGPVERARRRQLAFTADASHELRTPLSVIEAETSLTLQRERDAVAYREAVGRIARESVRLRHIVDDLLWLARFDAEPQAPKPELIDLPQLAQNSVARFQTLAEGKSIRLVAENACASQALVEGPLDWLDRMVAVLLDNACRYTPPGGEVSVRTLCTEGRLRLVVDDSGPGIPPGEEKRIFERFHRANQAAGGAGLGLAIADAVVQATQGRWQVGVSSRGGASFEVSWSLHRGRRSGRTQAESLALDPN